MKFNIETTLERTTPLDAAERIYMIADDAFVSSMFGFVTVAFDREAKTLKEAIRTAREDLLDAQLDHVGVWRVYESKA